MTVLVTGAAGFIGAHDTAELLGGGREVVGCDSLSSYYSREMKLNRFKDLCPDTELKECDLANPDTVRELIKETQPSLVIHLAAQPGVRYGFINPEAYFRDNIRATWNVMNESALKGIPVMYASSSSVYGETGGPLSEDIPTNNPESLYAATKITAELFAKQLQHTHSLRSVGLRFFTVYGPWGRPDMAILRWINNTMNNEDILVTGRETQTRDVTYITDVSRAVHEMSNLIPSTGTTTVNIGGGNPHTLTEILSTITQQITTRTRIQYGSKATGDVSHTWADTTKQKRLGLTVPKTGLREGITETIHWAKQHANKLPQWIESSRDPIV